MHDHLLARRGFVKAVGAVIGASCLPGSAAAYGPPRGESSAPLAPLVRFPAPWTSPFRVDPLYPYHLINQEGDHLYLLNKTAWAYFGCEDPNGVVQRARAQGMTVLRVALEGTPYLDHLGIDLWPWGGTRHQPDWSSFDDVYWAEVERRVRIAGEAGLGLNLTLYFTLRPEEGDVEQQRPYWEQTIGRLAKYANILTWEIANEYVRNEGFQDVAGPYFRAHDPHRRPVITSDGTTDDAIWPHKPWMDLAIVHTCTSSTPAHDLRDWYQSVARNNRSYGKPSFNNESGREIRHRNDDPVHRRKQGWIWSMSGGYWTWHSWEGCEGIDDANYRGPGSEFNRPMSDFFHSIPFWRLNPNRTAFAVDVPGVVKTTLSAADRSLVLSYLCTRESGRTVGAVPARVRLPNGSYRIALLGPSDLRPISTLTVESRGLGQVGELVLPEFTDDLLVLLERTRAEGRTNMEGTQ